MLTAHTENWPVLKYFSVEQTTDDIELYRLSEIPDEHMQEAYFECGSHPDVVARVWQDLAVSLPDDCCAVLNGHNCLLHDQSDVIISVCMGTQYALRIPNDQLQSALAGGLEHSCNWGGSHPTMHLPTVFGPNWLFGAFDDREPSWVQSEYDRFRLTNRPN